MFKTYIQIYALVLNLLENKMAALGTLKNFWMEGDTIGVASFQVQLFFTD